MLKLTALSCLIFLFVSSAISQNFQAIRTNDSTYFTRLEPLGYTDIYEGVYYSLGISRNFITTVQVGNLGSQPKVGD